MKIGIQGSVLIRPQKTGVEYYAESLFNELAKQMPSSHFDVCYMSFFTRKPSRLLEQAQNVSERRIKFMPGKIYNLLEYYFFGLPFDLLAGVREDIFIFPNFVRWPLLFTRKSVVMVYDLGFLVQPQTLNTRFRKYLTRAVPHSIRRADHVVTISQSAKRLIMEYYGTPSDKITIAEPAIDHSFYVPAAATKIAEVKKKHGITDDYILYLGTIEPRKNIAGLLHAYSSLPADLQSRYQLVLAGGKGWLDDEINAQADKIPEGRLIRTGYIDQGEKPALYSGASTFVYPSLYEGWGMQLAEAMACGTPVISSDNSSLPEAGGDAALYVRAGDDEVLASAIQRVLSDPKLVSEMVKKGKAHAASFTWAKSAQRFKEALDGLN